MTKAKKHSGFTKCFCFDAGKTSAKTNIRKQIHVVVCDIAITLQYNPGNLLPGLPENRKDMIAGCCNRKYNCTLLTDKTR